MLVAIGAAVAVITGIGAGGIPRPFERRCFLRQQGRNEDFSNSYTKKAYLSC